MTQQPVTHNLKRRTKSPSGYGFILVMLTLITATVLGTVQTVNAQNATATPTATPTLTPTATATMTPTPTATSAPASLYVREVEPTRLINTSAHTLSLYGTGFTSNCTVRLEGYGLLATTFVNAEALTAQVPAGVPAGTYSLLVSDVTQGDTYRISNAITLVEPEPEPTPKPPSEPKPGRPILTIRNFTVEPARVRAGDEFVVTIEIYNNGSRAGENTMAVFPGASFIPIGEGGHLLWQLHINHTVVVSQKLRAPSEMASGVHQVQIDLSANDWEGNHYDYPQTVPVEVIGKPTAADFTGQPKVIIEEAVTTPPELIPGEPFSLTLQLANRGSRTAINILATAASSEMAIPASGGDTVSTPKIGIEESVTVTLPLMLSTVETGGRQTMAIALAYSDYGGGSYSAQQNIGVDVNTSLTRQPQLILETYTTEPDFLAPGDTFTLTLQLSNVGGGDAGRLTVALGGEGGASLTPFIPRNAGNVLFVNEVKQGERVTLTRQLLIDGSADAKAYNLPIALAYDDPRASRQEDVQRLSLIVRKRPELQVKFFRQPDTLTVGNPMPVSLEIINIGRHAVNVTEITAQSPAMEVQVEGLPFVGPLDPGGSAPLDLLLVPQAGGPAEIVVSTHYRNDFNQTELLTGTLSVEVMAQSGGPTGPGSMPGDPGGIPGTPGAQPTEAPETLWQKIGRAIKGFFGFGS